MRNQNSISSTSRLKKLSAICALAIILMGMNTGKLMAQCDTPLVSISIDTSIECYGDSTAWLTVHAIVGPSPVLISELDRNSPDFIEVTNVSGGPVDLTGYKIATSDSYTVINTANSLTWTLSGVWQDSAVDYREDATGSKYWGNNLFYNSTSPGWVIIIDPNNNVVDALFWGWSATAIATFSPTIGSKTITLGNNWKGAGAGSCSNSHQRSSNIDNDTLSDFSCSVATKGTHNITITPSSFVPNLSYTWNTGDTVPSIGGLDTGIYWVVVTNNNGNCSNSDTVVLTQPDSITATYFTIDVKCNGDTTGLIVAKASGGKGGFIYQWSHGANGRQQRDLGGGVYGLLITDKKGCTFEDSVEISEPPALDVSGAVTDEFTGNDGAIDLTVSGGVSPYTFDWDNGETTEDLTGLAGGTYGVTITDSNNCTDSTSYTIQSFVGINDFTSGTLSIYPNPNAGSFTIEFEKTDEGIVYIYNANGQEVYAEALRGRKKLEIDLNNSIQDGLYLINLITGQNSSSYRLIIQRE